MNRFLLSSVAILVAVSSGQAFATPEDALVAFDGLCVATKGRIATIERMATAAHATPVPFEVVLQDSAAAKFGGKGFAFGKSVTPFIVIATNQSTCSVLLRGEQATKVVQLLERTYPVSAPFVETAGPQIVRFYRLIEPSVLAGGYLAVIVPKPEFVAEPFMSIGYVPAEVATAMRREQ